MSLADPQSITIGATPFTLPRISSSVNAGSFASNDGAVKEEVSHQYGKRDRHLFRVEHEKVAPDPFQADLNARYSMSSYLVIDVPQVGYTVSEAKEIVDGMIAQLSANTGALITQILGGEN